MLTYCVKAAFLIVHDSLLFSDVISIDLVSGTAWSVYFLRAYSL